MTNISTHFQNIINYFGKNVLHNALKRQFNIYKLQIMKKLLISLVAMFAFANVSMAQEAAIKWNPLYLGMGSVNLGVEFSVAPKWTLTFEGTTVMLNPWKNANNSVYANGWMGTFEARWYTCEAFNGHHLGLYGTVGRFGNAYSNFDLLNTFSTLSLSVVMVPTAQTTLRLQCSVSPTVTT